MTPPEVFLAARKLLEPEGAWTQGTYARNAAGGHVTCWDPTAVCWCLEGAIRKAANDEDEWSEAFAALGKVLLLPSLWNDHPGRRHKDVLDLLDRLSEGQS